MAGEKNVENPESMVKGLKSEPDANLADQDVASGKDGMPSDSSTCIPSVGEANVFSMKGDTEPDSVGGNGAYNPPTSCYKYYYPGSNGSFTPSDENGQFHIDGSQTGIQSDNGSYVYYMPGYNPYATGTLVGVDGQCVGQQPYFTSSGYLQHPVPYGSEAVPCYSWDSTYVGDAPNGNPAGFGNAKHQPGPTAFSKLNGLNSMKTNSNGASKYSKSIHSQPIKPLSKVPHLGSDFSAGLLKGYYPAGKFPSYTNQKQGFYPHNGSINYRSNGRVWNHNDRYKKPNKNGDFASAELTRGPRAQSRSAPLEASVKKEELGLTVCRDQYNLPDFQTEYENAKFYVIKSYNEDDIHKCIKYAVWASTPNGNKKLNASYHDAEAKASETGKRCPIFLFFSVNGSGQFVGLAEMVGQVDFNKDMDFWQLDKWNGFFPVNWHVIKDIPNNELRHIILENNENKPVTFSRDTQEIQLKQGLEMLKIFNNYCAKTSLLDDFNFYENREKSLQTRKVKPATLQMDIVKDGDLNKPDRPGEKKMEESLVNLTKNLSLNDRNLKSNGIKIPIEN